MALPDDPYHALGVPSDATAAAIKTAYRKLVLKHHPDKVNDDALKQAAADQFHKIQSAWETVGDEDKRTRYDAQARLTALRKEVLERDGQPVLRRAHTDMRPSPAFRSATEQRTTSRSYPDYRTEEVRPQDAEFFDRPRSDRRDFDYSHEKVKKSSPREDRHKPKLTRESTKEADRARQREKARQTAKATNRNRDYKYAYARAEVVSDADSDEHHPSPITRSRRSPRDDEDVWKSRDKYFEQARREQEAAASARVADERSRKIAEAREYIERSRSGRYGESNAQRRPSPNRMSSSREHIEALKADSRPAGTRRSSGRSKLSRDEMDLPRRSRREDERELRSSSEFEDQHRRPPGLNQSQSAPNDIRIPLMEKQRSYPPLHDAENIRIPSMERQRSYSVQHDADDAAFIPPPVRRTESMPHKASSRREETRGRSGRSTLRQSQVQDEHVASRKPAASYPGLGIKKEYADDHEFPTPDGYRIEVREPTACNRKITRSPSPIQEQRSERKRGSSSRHASPQVPPPINTRTTSTSYMYSPNTGLETLSATRPSLYREGSSRKSKDLLFGEMSSPRPSPRDREPMSAPPDGVSYREIRPEVKVQTGYTSSRRPSDGRSQSYYKSSSFTANPVSA